MKEEIKDNETVDLKELFISYLTHWKLIGGCTLFSLIVAIFYLIFYPKTYEVTAQILLQDDKETFSSGGFGLGEAAGLMKSFGLNTNSGSSIVLDDELVILSSNKLLREMIIQLGIYVDYSEPYTLGYRLYGTEPLKVSCDSVSLPHLERTFKLDIHHKANGIVEVDAKVKFSTFNTYKQSFKFESLPATIEMLGHKLTIDYSDFITNKADDFRLLVDVNPPTFVAEELYEEFLIEDYSKSSNVLQMTCRDYERRRAVDMFSTLITCYNRQAEDYKQQLGKRSLSFVSERLNNALVELGKIEASIESYKTKNKITMVEFDVQMYATAMQELQTKIIELEAQRHLIDLMDQFVRNPENKYKLVPSLYTPSTDGSGEGPSGGALSSYNQTLVERERVIKNSSEQNPMVATLTAQADRMRESVFTMIENSRKSLDLTYQSLKDKEKQILSRMDKIPQQERSYIDLKRQQEIYQGVYLVLLQKQEEINITLGEGKERARIIDEPYVKSGLVAPRKLYAAIGVIVFTMLFSMVWLSMKWLVLSVWSDLKKELKK